MGPLPGGTLPADQTVEGGAQLRVTQHGLATVTSVVKPLLDQQLAAGFCLPAGSTFGVSYCAVNQAPCQNGCRIVPTLNSVTLGAHPTDAKAIRAHIDADATASVPVKLGGTCNVGVAVDQVVADIDIGLDIAAASGELAIHARPITNLTVSGIHVTSQDGVVCTAVGGAINFVVGLLGGTVTNQVRALLSPAIGNVIDALVPSPLGVVGTADVGQLLAGLSPGTQARLETRLVPGSYAHMRNGGLSLGVITGINADRDPSTRAAGLASEPARCVPALPAPRLGAAPVGLQPTQRGTFQLDPAAELDGAPEAPSDVAIGISETTLDLAGYHVVTSGALCLDLGTSLVPQLTVGTLAVLARSLGQLTSDTGRDPVLLVTRPQRALDFRIGDNTAASPALTIGVEHLEVDFYAFVYERYVRAFTLDLSLDAGVNLDFTQAAGQLEIHPMLVGIDAQHVTVKAINTEFVAETPGELEAVLPSLFNLVIPLVGNLPAIAVPPLLGASLADLRVRHVTTAEDDFLTIDATLGAAALAQAGRVDGGGPAPSAGAARLVGVETPEADRVRAALLHEAGGALPRVTFDVDRSDAAGRALEWSYQLDGGLWRQWRSGAPLVIEDPAFAWQGKYTIGLRSRVVGDYRTVSPAIAVPVIIDSVAPRIAAAKAVWSGDVYVVPAFDEVSGGGLRHALGRPDDAAPRSAWSSGGARAAGGIAVSREDAEAYSDGSGQIRVFAADEAGNIASAVVAPLPAGTGVGCGCDARSAPGAGGLIGLIVVAHLVLRRRARRRVWGPGVRRAAVWAAVAAGSALAPGCSCGAAARAVCESTADCDRASCDPGMLAFCLDSTCVCSADIAAGRIGPYSDVAVGPDGAIWVSAYAQSHGDLVVARASGGRIADEVWEWVDGVPAGPVAVPGSKIRGGIDDNGPDVGMYTSIAVGRDGVPMVSYFDRDTASLKLAQRIDGAWQIHVIEHGTGTLGDAGVLVGMYTSLILRGDDGRPGVAYLAHVADGAGQRAEVRFAGATSPHPTTAADWKIWVVDSAPLPAADPANPAQFPLPDGLGLFVDAARLADQTPVVAYYDRSLGDLKLARFDAAADRFAAPRVLDGSGGRDAGWSPSIAVDASGVVDVAYAGATGEDLRFVRDAAGAVPEVVDDGYRTDGQTADGVPRPVFHFVGADAGLVVLPGGAPLVVYQDATTQELLLAQRQASGAWGRVTIAGSGTPSSGGYGFFASSALGGGVIVMSTWVVDLADDASWVEVFTRPLSMP